MKKWFENLKIARKLITGFFLVAFMAIIIGVVGVISILNIKDNDARLYEEDTLGLNYAGDAAVTFMQIRYNSLKLLYANDQTTINETVAALDENFSQMDELLAQCHETIKNDDIKILLDDIQADWDTYKPAMLLNNEATLNGTLNTVDQSMVTLGNTLRDDYFSLFNMVSEVASDKAANNAANARNAVIITIVVIFIAVLLALLLGIYISGIISKPIKKFAAFAELLAIGDIDIDKVLDAKDKLLHLRKDEIGVLAGSFDKVITSTVEQAEKTRAIADGDLTTEITIRSEFDVLGKALSELVSKFHSLASSIVSSAEMVDSGAKLVADTSTSISRGASEQASSVEQLTASLEETTSQTTQNAKNAQTTDELTKNIKKDAEAGNTQMAEMLRAMDDINTSSDNIKKIIKVIEDIAFQTNILALNAAVEAARAGQHGKGFAVVAEEVRNLAAQSASAAKETTDLIENSIKKVEAGTKIANETAGALSKISTGTAKAAELVDAIASASSEQSMALNQINQGVIQVSDVVQSNAAAAEECAAASEELSTQANNLKASAAVFKLNMSNMDTQSNKAVTANSKTLKIKNTSKPEISLTEKNFGKY